MTPTEAELRDYLARGGTITQAQGFTDFVPRKPHTAPVNPAPAAKKPEPRQKKNPQYPEWTNRELVAAMIKSARIRRRVLVVETGISGQRLAYFLDGTFNPSPADATRLQNTVLKLFKEQEAACKR